MSYSVLMSVYIKEKAEYLIESMNSIFNQTVKTNDFVLVCDGPLNDELNNVICDMKVKFGSTLNIIRLERNVGLGRALNIGLKQCKNDLVARMDSDDVSFPNRCEKQLMVFKNNPSCTVVSGIVEEFENSIDNVINKRIVPETNYDIIKFAKRRNPFNHPCVMYKKECIEKVGGYKDFYLLEDYYLWIRLINNGFEGYNIQEPLLYMRAGSGMYKRRGGIKYAISQIKLLLFMRRIKFISFFQFFMFTLSRIIVAIIPTSMRKIIFKMLLRS